MFITLRFWFDSRFRTQEGKMSDYDFEETYMSLTKKELVKVIKRKINEALKYKEMWEHRGKRIDYLTELLDENQK